VRDLICDAISYCARNCGKAEVNNLNLNQKSKKKEKDGEF